MYHQNDLTTIRKRFYPTVYDSVFISTSIALERGVDITKVTEANQLVVEIEKNLENIVLKVLCK